MVPITLSLGAARIPELDAARDRAADLSPAMAAIVSLMLSETELRFETETAPDGSKWTPSKRALDTGTRTLRDSGALQDRIDGRNGPDWAEWGSDRIYANVHNSGGVIAARNAGALNTPFGPRKSVTMPRRQFIGFSDDDTIEIEAILIDHLTDGDWP